jgi:hypothetical protein
MPAVTVSVSAALLAMTIANVVAQPPSPCHDRVRWVGYLAEAHGERPVAIGLSRDGSLVELLVSDDRQTWTFIRTQPGGVACLVDAGESWQSLRPAEKLPPPD